MLERMSLAEFTNWMAYYSDSSRDKQKPDALKAALKASLAAGRKKKR